MESIDRLSALPDSLLVHILSFVSLVSDDSALMSLDSDVNVRYAARTSVLSKRWRYLWCELTNLQFFHSTDQNGIDETSTFVSMVYSILLSRTAKSLEEFNVRFIFYNQTWASHVDMWVRLALKLNSKILRLSLPPEEHSTSTWYLPPESLYSNSVLMELGLECCIVSPRRRVDWKSLTKLRMVDVELQQHVVENILTGCPVMCSLELRGCWGFNSLKIDSRRLHKLSVIEAMMDALLETLEISSPYLSILEIKIWPNERKVWLKNISADVEVKVDIGGFLRYTERIPADVINVVKKLFDEIQHIKKLHMKTHFFKFVSEMVADGWQLQQQTRLLSLKIDNLYCGDINSGVLRVLEFCPNLETLQLHEVANKPLSRPPLSMSDDLNCDLLHLKMVGMKISVTFDEISLESCPMLMFIRILLRRAVALEKMEIRFEIMNRDVMIKDRAEFDNVVEEVLSWPKSSQALLITSLTHTKSSYW